MRFTIEHETDYHYSVPASSTVQILRLTPRSEPNQRVLSWSIEAPGKQVRQVDAFGNITHLHTLYGQHQKISVKVHGVVELSGLDNGRIDSNDAIPVTAYGLATPLTTPSPAMREFAQQALPKGIRNSFDALLLATRIADVIDYLPGSTEVSSTAIQAFDQRRGVCQDHAHIYLACCRALGTPARYVSGYVHPGTASYAASHAWVDVWLQAWGTEPGGWISIDVTNRQLTSDRHCRLAVARDYESAAPIRGVRTGGGEETMEVQVRFGSSRTDQ